MSAQDDAGLFDLLETPPVVNSSPTRDDAGSKSSRVKFNPCSLGSRAVGGAVGAASRAAGGASGLVTRAARAAEEVTSSKVCTRAAESSLGAGVAKAAGNTVRLGASAVESGLQGASHLMSGAAQVASSAAHGTLLSDAKGLVDGTFDSFLDKYLRKVLRYLGDYGCNTLKDPYMPLAIQQFIDRLWSELWPE
eukprot:6962142-Prymnesium_polylepis.1